MFLNGEIVIEKRLSFFRLVKAFTELDEYLKNELELIETKEYIAASVVLAEAKQQMEDSS